jgi:long-chain acyl-CoA synthetase
MPYPGAHAKTRPDHPAVILSSNGEGLDHRQLDERSNRIAQFLKSKGFRPGDHVAILMENNVRYFEIVWAALRSGLVITPINRHLTADEAAYIVDDCDARALFTSAYMAPIAETLSDRIPPHCRLRLVIDGACNGYEDLDEVMADQPPTPLAEEHRGHTMLYSSGTTGKPKGIVRNEPPGLITDGLPQVARIRDTYGIDETTVYLSPARSTSPSASSAWAARSS